MDTASIQDKSTALLVTLASSLLSSFSPSDVITESGRANCSEALLTVSSLSSLHLAGSKVNAQLVAELVSAYTIKSTTTVYGSQSNVSYFYDVAKAAALLVEGVQLGMASGELDVSLVTSNVQVSVTSTLISASGNLTLTTPATASQLAYGSITFAGEPTYLTGDIGIAPGTAITAEYVAGHVGTTHHTDAYAMTCAADTAKIAAQAAGQMCQKSIPSQLGKNP